MKLLRTPTEPRTRVPRLAPVPAWPIAEPRDAPAVDRGRGPVRISCVVPCFNEAANIDALLPRLCQAMASLSAAWEVVLVDDGSSDGTAQRLQAWARKPGVRGIRLSRNFGKEAALTAGLQAARGDVVAMLDADLQHPPELIAQMLERWREGADMVYAVREHRDDESRFKRAGTRLFYALVNAADRFDMPRDAGDFRLMDRAAVDALLALPERNRFLKGMYAWVGFNSVAVPYQPTVRAAGHSHFSAWRLIRLALDGMTGFTTWPLRAVSITGFAMAFLAFGYGGYLSASYLLFGNPVSGWTTIVVTLMLFLGIQMISLGIVGEYVGRIFEEVKARPLYIVEREWGQGLSDA
jgi:polyisoprenyl-phosphate glycosyltransferase